MKIVLNRYCRRFELSKAGLERLIELKIKSTGYKNVYCYKFIFDEDGKMYALISPFNISNAKDLILLTNETFDNVTKLSHDDFKELKCYLMNWRGRDSRYDDEDLITVVEELGAPASKDLSNLKVVEIPDDYDWLIDQYIRFERLFS